MTVCSQFEEAQSRQNSRSFRFLFILVLNWPTTTTRLHRKVNKDLAAHFIFISNEIFIVV